MQCVICGTDPYSAQGDERHARLHQQLTSTVQGLHKKVCSKIRTFEAQLSDVAKVDAVQKQADIITANIYRIPAGGFWGCESGPDHTKICLGGRMPFLKQGQVPVERVCAFTHR